MWLNKYKINKITNVKYVCDNDSSKWGNEIIDGMVCISPEELEKMDNVIVIILVYSKSIVTQIANQLEKMNVCFDYMDNWLACVE